MDRLLKIISCLMLATLVITQLLLSTPYRERIADDSLNGRTIKTSETVISSGSVTLNAMGSYVADSAILLINGEPVKTIDSFPLEITITDGDVVELRLKPDSSSFYVFLTDKKGPVKVEIEESTILIKPGINRLAIVRKLQLQYNQ